MFWITILNKAVAIWKNVLDKGSQGLPQNGNELWGIHFAFKDGQSRPATTTDTCPDVHLHRMLGLGLIVWLASSLVAACAPVSFHLHSKDNVLKGIVVILFGLRQSLLLIQFPNHLSVSHSSGCPSQINFFTKDGCHQCIESLNFFLQ